VPIELLEKIVLQKYVLMQVAEGGSEVNQLHPLLPLAPLLCFECIIKKPCNLLYKVASIVHPFMLLSFWVFPFVNK
jgi:hypothetical protein